MQLFLNYIYFAINNLWNALLSMSSLKINAMGRKNNQQGHNLGVMSLLVL